MPQNIKLQLSANAGPQQQGQDGGVEIDFEDVLVFSLADASGVKKALYRIYEYPEGFALPSGWSEDPDDGSYYVIVANGGAAPPVTAPASPLWGGFLVDVEVDGRRRNGQVAQDLYDNSLGFFIESASGVEDPLHLETNQFNQRRQWAAKLKSLARFVDGLSVGSGGSAAATTYDNTTSGLTADDVQDAIDEVVAAVEALDLSGEPGGTDRQMLFNDGDEIDGAQGADWEDDEAGVRNISLTPEAGGSVGVLFRNSSGVIVGRVRYTDGGTSIVVESAGGYAVLSSATSAPLLSGATGAIAQHTALTLVRNLLPNVGATGTTVTAAGTTTADSASVASSTTIELLVTVTLRVGSTIDKWVGVCTATRIGAGTLTILSTDVVREFDNPMHSVALSVVSATLRATYTNGTAGNVDSVKIYLTEALEPTP